MKSHSTQFRLHQLTKRLLDASSVPGTILVYVLLKQAHYSGTEYTLGNKTQNPTLVQLVF